MNSIAGPTTPYEPASQGVGAALERPPVALVPRSVSQPTELQALLHKRLKVAMIVGLAAGAVASVGLVPTFVRNQSWEFLAQFLVVVGLSAVNTAILCWRRSFSLRALRTIELITVGLIMGVIVWHTFRWYIRFRFPLILSILGEGEVQYQTSKYSGSFTLSDWPMIFLANSMNLHWSFLIVGYGLTIPNTWRRCTAVVGTMTITAIGLGIAMAWSHEMIVANSRYAFLFHIVFWMLFAAAIAIASSHRIETLRREAAKARRLGQYRLKERLGTGGMGEVYLAEHALLQRPCAIKLIKPEHAGDPKNLLRFEREVQATARLTHWNTVEIFDYGHAQDGTFYYVMEYLPGLTLEEMVTKHGPLPPGRAHHFLLQGCAALREAHAGGLIHRDIKPSNIIICERGGIHDVAKLLDFGLVREENLGSQDAKLTQEGSIAGTPAYMSPEQAAGNTDLDARSDIYSLGAVAYYLLTGKPPFVAKTPVQVLAAHLHQPPQALTEIRHDIPVDLQAIVLRCLEKQPERRFQKIDDLSEALAHCQDVGQWNESQAAAWWQEYRACISSPQA